MSIPLLLLTKIVPDLVVAFALPNCVMVGFVLEDGGLGNFHLVQECQKIEFFH